MAFHIAFFIPDYCQFSLLLNRFISYSVIGFGSNKKTSISDIQIFKKSVGQAEAGENVGINIKDAPIHTLKRGMMLAKVNSFQPTNHFEGTAYFLTKVMIVYLKHFGLSAKKLFHTIS